MSKINKIDLFAYDIPLKDELLMLGNKMVNRQGLFLKYYDAKGGISWGEISPFNGLHKENIPNIINYIKSNNIAKEIELFKSGVKLRTPLLLLMAYEQIMFYSNIINLRIPDNVVSISPLFTGNNDKIINNISLLSNKSLCVIKLKMGRNNLYDDINLFNIIDNKLSNNIKIRVDVNQAWTYKEASIFAKSINISRIDYIEEPLKNPAQLNKYYKEYNIKYALDETIHQTREWHNLLIYKGCSAFIIKPSLLGTLKNIDIINTIAKSNNINLVFSSAFESGYSLAYYIYLASIYSKDTAHGFDTYKYLSYDILKSPLVFNNFKISVNSAINSMKTVSENNLKLVMSDL